MNVLIDTNLALDFLYAPNKLSNAAKTILYNPKIGLYISAISLWEIEMKRIERGLGEEFNTISLTNKCRESSIKQSLVSDMDVMWLENFHIDDTDVKDIREKAITELLLAQACSRDMVFITNDTEVAEKYKKCVGQWHNAEKSIMLV